MKEQINALKQLQELVLTRDEHHQTGDGSHLDELTDSIAGIEAKLIPQVKAVYERLYKKNHVVLAAMSNGCCAACGMQVPISMVQQVRLGQHLVTCSSCGRILSADEDDAVHNVTVKGDGEETRVGIARFSAPELMITNLKGSTPQDAIAELAALMEKTNRITNADSMVAAAMEREAVLSTAIGEEMAFPHVRGVEGGGLTLAMGISRKGIKWDSENKVRLVFLSAIPVAVSAFYLRLMSGLVQAFDKKSSVDQAMAAKDSAALWSALCKLTRTIVR